MHFTILASALLLAASTIAKPLPGQSLAEIERRWSAGETEVCHPNSPGCYFYAWYCSLAAALAPMPGSGNGMRGQDASIHSGLTHRDATPAWPIARERDADVSASAFSYATDERTLALHSAHAAQSSLRHRRWGAIKQPLLAKMKTFVSNFYRARGNERKAGKAEKAVVARDDAQEEADAAPVLQPRRGMKYAFRA